MEHTQNVSHDIENTNTFTCRGKEYHYNIFRLYEKSPSTMNIIKKNESTILLTDEECSEEADDVLEGAINTVIYYINNDKCVLHKNQIAILNKIACKFHLTRLSHEIEQYMILHSNEFIIEFLSGNYNIDNYNFEILLANNLMDHIDDRKLLDIPHPSMQRIIDRYISNHQNSNLSGKIKEFLFNYLEKHGKEASTLYEQFDLTNNQDIKIQLLNSENFDGHYADKRYSYDSYNIESEIIKKTEKNEIKNLELQNYLKDFRASIENKIINLEKTNNSLNNKLDQKTNEINNLFDEINRMNAKINEQESQMNEKTNEINRLNAQLAEYNEKQQILENNNKVQQKQIDNLIIETRKNASIIDDFDLTKFIGDKCTLETFNSYNAETQKFIISKIELNNENKEFIQKISALIEFLSEQQNKTKSQIITKQYLYLISNTNEKNLFDIKYIDTVGIPSEMVEILYANGSLESNEFIEKVDVFNDICFYINIHAGNYQDLDISVKKLKNEKGYKYKQGIVFSKEDNIFFQNRDDLYSIIISVENIKGGYNAGLCERNKYLRYVILSNKVKNIGDGAFYKCHNLSYILLPDSLSEIGQSSFAECNCLTTITINPNKIKLKKDSFKSCPLLHTIKLHPGMNSIKYFEWDKYFNVTEVILPNSIEEIGEKAFYNCSTLKKIVINSSIKSIGNSAFENCSLLSDITIHSSITKFGSKIFKNCTSLEKFVIPSSIKNLGHHVFEGCLSLKNIEIPSSVTHLGNGTFIGCKSLKSIMIPSSVNYFGTFTFKNCSSLSNIYLNSPSSLNGNMIFEGCTSLKSLNIPFSVIEISNGFFTRWTSFSYISIPSSVARIGESAFEECTFLTHISIPPFVTEIEKSLFHGCKSLIQVSIPSFVTLIGKFAFKGCTSLTHISIPSSVKKIEESAFEGCTLLSLISIPSSVEEIGESVFKGCESLTQISIPSSVAEIKQSCFKGCIKLKEITLDPYKTKIRDNTFEDCNSLEHLILPSTVKKIVSNEYNSSLYIFRMMKKITIPDSVESIEAYAFNFCSSLVEINIPSSVKSIGDQAFFGCNSLGTLKIPDSVTIGKHAFLKL